MRRAAEPKVLELYIRRTDLIVANREHSQNEIGVDELIPALRLPIAVFPDPRVVQEDALDQIKHERDMEERAELAEEERLIRIAQREAKKEEQAARR